MNQRAKNKLNNMMEENFTIWIFEFQMAPLFNL